MLTDWLVRTFVANPEDILNARTRFAFGTLEGWTSAVVDLVTRDHPLCAKVGINVEPRYVY